MNSVSLCVSTKKQTNKPIDRPQKPNSTNAMNTAFLTPDFLARKPRPHNNVRFTPACVTHRRPRLDDVMNDDGMTDVVKGGIVVPRHRWRRDLRQKGVHRSVEYIVERLQLDNTEINRLYDAPEGRRLDVQATMRPAGRLIPRLERPWPVTVRVGDAKLWSYKRDVAVCAAVCIGFSVAVLCGAVAAGELCGIYGIVSDSMIPTLFRGDALLVEKVSIRAAPARRGEVVLVRPPPQVQDAARKGGRALRFRDALIKRVVAVDGDLLEVDEKSVHVNGKVVGTRIADFMVPYVRKGTCQLPKGYVYVLGDNGDASVDSRFWGLLPASDVIGRPVARIFPPDRIGVWGHHEGGR